MEWLLSALWHLLGMANVHALSVNFCGIAIMMLIIPACPLVNLGNTLTRNKTTTLFGLTFVTLSLLKRLLSPFSSSPHQSFLCLTIHLVFSMNIEETKWKTNISSCISLKNESEKFSGEKNWSEKEIEVNKKVSGEKTNISSCISLSGENLTHSCQNEPTLYSVHSIKVDRRYPSTSISRNHDRWPEA